MNSEHIFDFNYTNKKKIQTKLSECNRIIDKSNANVIKQQLLDYLYPNLIKDNEILSILKISSKFNSINSKIKNVALKDFTFNQLIENFKNINSSENKIETEKIKKISGIKENIEAKNFIFKHPKNSFIFSFNFKLQSPYYSKDDDEFYPITNNIIKEKIFKTPMIRGSSWKGIISKSFLNCVFKDSDFFKNFDSFLRLFGSGSTEFREIENKIDLMKNNNDKNGENLLLNFLNYCIFSLGINTKFSKEKISDSLIQYINKSTLKTQKGMLIFYPTYFNKISFEVINPQNRGTRAGKNPIFYEVVPKKTEGILQLVYVPYNLTKYEQVILDFQNILKCVINAIEKEGIGAKSKLGWGIGKISKENSFYYFNNDEKLKEIENHWKGMMKDE